jgi:hypothetical protein
MSDPVTKAEIEDVLSSIRRLVSSDGRAQPRLAEAAQPATPPVTPAPDRLVLTPALRVAEPDAAPAKTARPADPDDAAPDATAEDQSNEPWRDADATLFATARIVATPKPEPAPGYVAEDRPDPSGNADAARFDPARDDDDPIDPPQTEADGPVPGAVADPAWDANAGDGTDTSRVESLSAKIQALELAIGRTRDRWEPDGVGGDDDYAGTTVETIEWEDHSEAPDDDDAAGPIPERPRARAEIDDRPDFSAEDDSFLDENSLRELVADIVRQELMGALGERITRNVRKLVRREIHRALTAQELD